MEPCAPWCPVDSEVLSQACRYGHVQHLEHLLFYGADMGAQNASGNTALHICALYNQVSMAPAGPTPTFYDRRAGSRDSSLGPLGPGVEAGPGRRCGKSLPLLPFIPVL